MTPQRTVGQQIIAWCVHFYTALGIPLAVFSMLALIDRRAGAFFVLNGLAMLVDGTDGMLARKARVKQVLPSFDGGTLDNVIDFLTFAFLPAIALIQLEILPTSLHWLAIVPVVASGYGFSQLNAKTTESFVGFPSYWNLVVFYCFTLHLATPTVVVLLVGLSILVFVPVHYLYPSRTALLKRTTLVLGSAYFGMYIAVSTHLTASWSQNLAWASLFFVVYYTIVSGIHHVRVHNPSSN